MAVTVQLLTKIQTKDRHKLESGIPLVCWLAFRHKVGTTSLPLPCRTRSTSSPQKQAPPSRWLDAGDDIGQHHSDLHQLE